MPPDHAAISFRWRGFGHAVEMVFAAASVAAAGFAALLLSVGFYFARFDSPPATPMLEDRNGAYLSEADRSQGEIGYWDADAGRDSRIVMCFGIIEDRRFWDHWGVDLRSIGRAVFASRRVRQGASTIAMQVARMQSNRPRTAVNKLYEMSTALIMVLRYGHEAVMRQYLRIVPQGNQIHGVAYAARRFFRKPLADLSLAEAAVLASLAKSPGRMNLFSREGLDAARERARLVLRLLIEDKRIGVEDYEAALRQLASMTALKKEDRPATSYHYILRSLEEETARHEAYSGPVRTSLDPHVQEKIQFVAETAMKENARHDAKNIAIMVADRASGEILGYVGSTAYFDPENLGSINYADTPRSSGSILKPFLFARGLDTGTFTPGSILADLPFAMLSNQGEYRAANFDDDYLGPLLYRRALANSRNTPALRVLESVGLDDFYDLARRMKLNGEDRGASYYGYGMAIGGFYVTLENLVAAYGSLANDGKDFRLSWRRLDRAAENTSTQNTAVQNGADRQPSGESSGPEEQTRFFSPYAARSVAEFLSDNEARFPSFPRLSVLEYGFPVAVKTGTSQGYRDAWTIAWTSKYIVGVWMGNPDNRPTNRVAGIVSAVYVHDIIVSLQSQQEQGIDVEPFPHAPGTVAVEICTLSGQRAEDYCPDRSIEYFLPEDVPNQYCTVHRRIAVDTRDGGLVRSDTPPNKIAIQTFAVLPPEFAAWGARHGYGLPPAENASLAKPVIDIVRPNDGSRFLVDPGMPASFQSLPLEAKVQPRVPELVWYVDGKEFARVAYPYAVRLPLVRGTHRIKTGLPDEPPGEQTVSITVE